MITLTKQDIQNAVDTAKNRIMERMVTRQDVQMVCDASRDRVLAYVQIIQQQQLQLARQTNAQILQIGKRGPAYESRLTNIENELKNTHVMLQRITDYISEQQRVSEAPAQQLTPTMTGFQPGYAM